MFEYFPKLDKFFTKLSNPILYFLHKRMGFTPNNLSVIAAFFGFWGIFFVLTEKSTLAFIFIIIVYQAFDFLDGQVAKKYNLITKKGKILDLAIDKTIEFSLIFSFVFLKKVDLKIAVITSLSLLILIIVKEKSKFDFGLKKIGIFSGYLFGFNLAFLLVLLFNVIGIIGAFFILGSKNKTKTKPL